MTKLHTRFKVMLPTHIHIPIIGIHRIARCRDKLQLLN